MASPWWSGWYHLAATFKPTLSDVAQIMHIIARDVIGRQ